MESGVKLSTALVLETNNLQGGGAGATRRVASLDRLLRHLSGQTHRLPALTELVVTHHGFSKRQRDSLEATAGRSICFVPLPEGTGYYEAKNRGFEATRAAVVAFGDADCWPEARWLEALFEPFARSEGARVVAGRTTYRDGLLGAAATAIDFMYFHPSRRSELTKNFYANNVAFRREVFDAYRFRAIEGVYRGHCQMLGMRLGEGGVPIHFAPRARTVHRFPDTLRELAKLRLLRGQDTVELTPHLARTYLPRSLRRVGQMRFAALATLGMRWGYSLRAIGRQGMPTLRTARYLGCVGAMTALSALDAAGAAHRSLRGRPRAPGDDQSLSYHDDADRLMTPSPAAREARP